MERVSWVLASLVCAGSYACDPDSGSPASDESSESLAQTGTMAASADPDSAASSSGSNGSVFGGGVDGAGQGGTPGGGSDATGATPGAAGGVAGMGGGEAGGADNGNNVAGDGMNGGADPQDFQLGDPGDDGGDVPTDALFAYFAADCRLAVRCGTTGKSQEECEAPFKLSCGGVDAVLEPSAQDVTMCARMLDALSCEEVFDPPSGPCLRVAAAIEGLEVVGTGDACGGQPLRICPLTDLCVVAELACAKGTCMPAPQAGEPCLEGRCGLGLLCDVDRCTEPVLPGEGESCSDNLPCERGLACLEGTCRAPAGRGEPCAETGQCAMDLQCIGGACGYPPASCDPGRQGERCASGGLCASGTACVAGVCQDAPAEGQPCAGDSAQCAGAARCVPANPEADAFSCVVPRDPGEPCTLSFECRSGLCLPCEDGDANCDGDYCSAFDIGQPCDGDEACHSRNCVTGSCAPPVGDACAW